MKSMKALTYGLLVFTIVAIAGCDSFLDPDVHSQLAPENYLATEEGIESTLGAAYAEVMWGFGTAKYRTLHVSDWSTDIAWQTGGGENRAATLMINFSWDPASNVALMWNKPYNAIRDANIVLENLDRADLAASNKATLRAEARFIRALAYRDLYNWFGPVPLRTNNEQEFELPRATEEEMESFIETELQDVIADLPAPGAQSAYGRATAGAARGWLTKFYLNTKQWQKAADMAQEVIDMGTYSLYPDYFELFQVENERNDEFIWVDTASPQGPGNPHMNQAFPPGFSEHPRTGLTWQNNWNNWASQSRLRDAFFNSFAPDDERTELIVREYVTAQGDTVDLLNDFQDNTRAFKYWPDANAQGNQHGNDLPRIRYADILLMRAEALNELNGPSQASIDLINEVRNRAGLNDLSVGDFGSKEALRSHILQERAWEFYYEGLRREDLIRMGKFIEFAQDRGVNAQEYHRRYPIPQFAMDANPKLEQNPGY